jgi:hypothetical protein
MNHTTIQNTSCLSCIHCGKDYKNNTNLNKHVILCELLTRQQQSEDDILVTPSNKILFQMLIELGNRYKILEEKLQHVEISSKKKKVNVIEWLNENHKNSVNFSEWSVEIEKGDIDRLFESTLVDVFDRIFKRIKDLQNIPLFAFAQKKNAFYCFEDSCWSEMKQEDFIRFFGCIRIKLSKSLLVWKQENIAELISCDRMAQMYDSTNLKLMKYDFNNKNTCGRLKTILFSHIKNNIKPIIEYEIEF